MASSVRMKSNKQDRIKRDTSGACNNMGARDGVVEDWDEGASSVPVYASSHNTPHAAIATKETKDVLRLRLVVFFVLITFTIAVATSVYLHLHWNEESKFREHFHDDADKILQAVGSTLDNILGSFDSLAVSSISLARATNQSWPFVTLPHFAVRMSKLVPLSRSVVTFLSPIVQPKQRQAWEAYSVQNDDWLYESIELQREFKHYYGSYENHTLDLGKLHGDFGEIPQNESRIFLPTWQNFPVVPNSLCACNWDWLTMSFSSAPRTSIEQHQAVLSLPYMIPSPDNAAAEAETAAWLDYFGAFVAPGEAILEPVSDIYYPVVDDIDRVYVTGSGDYEPAKHKIVALLGASIYWRSLLRDALPKDSNGIHVVVENPCTAPFTYKVNGPSTVYKGLGDLHEDAYNNMVISKRLDELYATQDSIYSGAHLHRDLCPFTLHVYPSHEMQEAFTTNHPILFTVIAVLIFAFTSLVFGLYDAKVERRQQTILSTATRSSAIVSSLFPSSVCDRLYPIPEKKVQRRLSLNLCLPTSSRLMRDLTASSTDADFITSSHTMSGVSSPLSTPIAELYPDTTVIFADIAGFTAWSSQRQPTQVFQLLETVYAAFDAIARQRGVFKVETIGDSYVAVVGLPTPRNHHAVVMALFAKDCRDTFRTVTVELEKSLGPGTADLAMRFGLNSGPTTGGVLRGEKARFQLFGDTVNTAARMESNGERNRIQVSQKTAELITEAGKGAWLTPRDEKIDCKGKGLLTTFWCEPSSSTESIEASVAAFTVASTPEESRLEREARLERLVDWNVDLFTGLLKELAHCRPELQDQTMLVSSSDDTVMAMERPLEEVTEVLSLSSSPRDVVVHEYAPRNDRISAKVVQQLRHWIAAIAKLHQGSKNAFHNFEHSSLVIMSTQKLMDRMITSSNDNEVPDNGMDGEEGRCNISLSPLVRLAIAVAALIHNVDHPGVSNAQLTLEQDELSEIYNGQSVAEQHALVTAWTVLAEPRYQTLRTFIAPTAAELCLFRQIVVHVVLATDVDDETLHAQRHVCWIQSFGPPSIIADNGVDETNRRATLVAELIIQASDVAHAMQHFTVYKKWNLRILTEHYKSFKSGRTTVNPLDGWYEQELRFFDAYVIPLALKIKECGVFECSCNELLDFARDNRMEWADKGLEIVRVFGERLERRSRLERNM